MQAMDLHHRLWKGAQISWPGSQSGWRLGSTTDQSILHGLFWAAFKHSPPFCCLPIDNVIPCYSVKHSPSLVLGPLDLDFQLVITYSIWGNF